MVEFSCNYLVTEMSNLTLMRDFGSRKWHDFFFFLKNFRQITLFCDDVTTQEYLLLQTKISLRLLFAWISCSRPPGGDERAHIPRNLRHHRSDTIFTVINLFCVPSSQCTIPLYHHVILLALRSSLDFHFRSYIITF